MTTTTDSRWDWHPAITLLSTLTDVQPLPLQTEQTTPRPVHDDEDTAVRESSLGNFSGLWDFLSDPQPNTRGKTIVKYKVNDQRVKELDAIQLSKVVKWRDEIDGADLEDNVEPTKSSSSSLRTQKRAARRARAKERSQSQHGSTAMGGVHSDTATDVESGEELESLRRSPDRRALIANLIGRPRPDAKDNSSPPTSPSPPKAQPRSSKQDWPVSNPFLWTPSGLPSPSQRITIKPRDGLSPALRKTKLIQKLSNSFPNERRYLKNAGLSEPAFTPLNTSPKGVHVFVDMSNISIGFHDCLKDVRGINKDTRVKRVPLNFHNLSLILERGRPAAKRVLAGSDRTSAVAEAMALGYQANMLERVHKAKELTPRQKRHHSSHTHNGNTSASGPGETSGSETNTGYLSSSGPTFAQAKWVEQAVDEILHLKILESLFDNAKEPSTIVLATGDAAEAEYSGGFMEQVQRALSNGWTVEIVSFTKNTSNLYKREAFRETWGPMFKLVKLDEFVEELIDEQQVDVDHH